MKKILAINGSYRHGGITDQTVDVFARAAGNAGAHVEIIVLRDYPIEFCRNCRACTQQPGEKPGVCVLQDGMAQLIEKIETADAYILAAPTNYYSATAIFKRFMERLVPYAHWPWGMNAPRYRKAGAPRKKAIIVSSCAAPGFIGRWFYGTNKQLKLTAKSIGAEVAGSIYTGLVSQVSQPALPERVKGKIQEMVNNLIKT